MSTAVIGYVRVSTDDQSANGISLAAQRTRLEAYCAAHDLTLLCVEEDAGISAKATRNRPGLQRALAALRKREAAGLVAVKLDRLSRTTRDVLDLVARAEKEGWALHSIDERLDTSSPQGRFVVTVLGALAQLEREQAADRTRTAMAELRRQRKRTSRFAPFGYRLDGNDVVVAPVEQPLLQRMLTLQAEGHGCWKIAKTLNDEELPNPRTGRPWHFGTVRAILRTAARWAAAAHDNA